MHQSVDKPDNELEIGHVKVFFESRDDKEEQCHQAYELPSSKDMVCSEEVQTNVKTVVFSRRSNLYPEPKEKAVVGLCEECYTKTQQTIEDTFADSDSIGSAIDKIDFKCLFSDSSSSTDEDSIKPVVEEIEFKPLFIESHSSSDEEMLKKSAAVRSDIASEESVIEGWYRLCEVLKDHLLGLKDLDEELLAQSKVALSTKWLTVATDKYTSTKDLYNYLKYFQKFSEDLVKFVLHSTDPDGNNALHFAYGNNRFDMAEEFLNNSYGPALLRKRNKLGHTPLMICAVSQPETPEDWITVKKSVKMGNINEASPFSGQTALMNAASRGLPDMVQILLDAGADLNQRDQDGSTALMYAAEQGREACVALMLKHPACDPLLKDQDGQTASSIAIAAGHKNIALRIYLHTKKIPQNAIQQALKAHKKKNLPCKNF